ncbi:TPA: aminopeptidase P family protein [Candidatus Bathyarchaeota archaeon]|nr:aminopeptidase P family protein [Candidatus Bathyarchaeota archaeon]
MPDAYVDGSVRSVDELRPSILPLRQRAVIRNDWLRDRLENYLPELMKREGLDMWVVIAREYNEDPVIMSMLPEPFMYARRRTILLFTLRKDGTVERLTFARYGMGDFYKTVWDPDKEEQYDCLAREIKRRKPTKIGINVSETTAFGDGLTHGEYTQLARALGPRYAKRLTSAEALAVGWLEHRSQKELTAYPEIVAITHAIVEEAFSSRVTHPGVTTTDDVAWWMRQKMVDLGLKPWFPPTIDLQAPDQPHDKPAKRNTIQPGDLVHCDVGFYYLGLATDVQRNVYILKPGETDAPKGLKAALKDANRLQDILAGEMGVEKTGNVVLKGSREKAMKEGIMPSIYTHPLGTHGHAAGTTIGLWDKQDGVPGNGDYPLHEDTCYAIELNAKKAVPEWGGQEVRMSLEEDAVLTKEGLCWLSGRQTRLYLI